MSLHALEGRRDADDPGFTAGDAQALLMSTKFAPWVQELGLVVEQCSRDGVMLRMPWSPKLARYGNTLCGQAMLAAADTALVIAFCAALGRFQNCTTVSQTMNFMRSLPEGDVLIEAVVRKLGRNLVFAEATFRAPDRTEAAAQAIATWAILPS